MQKHCNLNATEAVLEITVKMDYNNIRLLWQRKLRLWVCTHLHEPVCVPALTGHGDLFNSPKIIIVQQFPMCNNFVFFCLLNCNIMGLGLNYSQQANPYHFIIKYAIYPTRYVPQAAKLDLEYIESAGYHMNAKEAVAKRIIDLCEQHKIAKNTLGIITVL